MTVEGSAVEYLPSDGWAHVEPRTTYVAATPVAPAVVEQYAYSAYGAPEPGPGAAPIAGVQGARYLVITVPPPPPEGGDPVAVVVTPAYDGGLPRYVGTPVTETPYRNRSLLVDDPTQAARKTPAEWGELLIFGPDIIPATEYDLQIDSGSPGCPVLSNTLRLKTARWGDVCGPYNLAAQAWSPPDGDVSVTVDVVAGLDAFRQQPTPRFAWADMLSYRCPPGQPDGRLVDILDVTMILEAFRGRPYAACPQCCDPPAGWSSAQGRRRTP